MAKEIDVPSLRLAINAILDHVVTDLGIRKVTVRDDKDAYWEVPAGRLHAFGEMQPRLDVGRLSEDADFLKEMAADTRQMVAAMLMHAAPLLRFMGEEIGM